MDINPSFKRVSDYLKTVVNSMCKEGFEWFPQIENKGMNLFDLLTTIDFLDNAEPPTGIRIEDERKDS